MQIEEKPTKLYYTIGEVSAMLSVSASMIRFWESEFPHLRPKTNKKGDRRYKIADIEAIKQVYILVKEKGYTLQGAKEHLKGQKAGKHKSHKEVLQGVREFLLEISRQLDAQ